MNIDEISNQYQIPIEILKKYENWGFCGTKKKLLGSWEYDDSDLENLRIIMTLHNIGFETTEIETYMKLLLGQQTTDTERLQMLEKKRIEILNEIHSQEKQLDHLDYLRYKIRNHME